MNNPFTLLFILAFWEIIKYAVRNLRVLAVEAYHANSVGYTEYDKMKAFKAADFPNRHGTFENSMKKILEARAERHKRWEEEAKTYSPEKQAAVDNPQRYFVGGF